MGKNEINCISPQVLSYALPIILLAQEFLKELIFVVNKNYLK